MNGSIAVGTNSTANFLNSRLLGDGTLKTTAKSATITVGGIGGAGNEVHFDLAKGGTLNIDNGMNFLGQVDIGREATVNVNSETYFYGIIRRRPWAQSRKSGTPKPTYPTFSMQRGRTVAQIGFAQSTPELYAAPNASGGVAVTTHHAAGDLPVTVVHS